MWYGIRCGLRCQNCLSDCLQRLKTGVDKETLNKSFDKLRTNGKWLISFVVSLSNHAVSQLVQCFL